MKISIYRKNDFTIPLTVKNKKTNTPINLTGCKIEFMVAKEHSQSSEKVIYKEITSHTDAANGKSTIILTNEDTDINAGSYLFEIRAIDSLDKELTYEVGEFTIKKSLK